MNEHDRRNLIRRRYGQCCGYCGVRETDVGSELEIDHFQPRSAGGGDDSGNLVYCCTACNRIKADFWPADRSAEDSRRLLHPKHDAVDQHIVEKADGRLASLTAVGAFHIDRLRLNRPPLVALRRSRLEHAALQQALADARAEQAALRTRIESLERDIDQVTGQIARLLES